MSGVGWGCISKGIYPGVSVLEPNGVAYNMYVCKGYNDICDIKDARTEILPSIPN